RTTPRRRRTDAPRGTRARALRGVWKIGTWELLCAWPTARRWFFERSAARSRDRPFRPVSGLAALRIASGAARSEAHGLPGSPVARSGGRSSGGGCATVRANADTAAYRCGGSTGWPRPTDRSALFPVSPRVGTDRAAPEAKRIIGRRRTRSSGRRCARVDPGSAIAGARDRCGHQRRQRVHDDAHGQQFRQDLWPWLAGAIQQVQRHAVAPETRELGRDRRIALGPVALQA